MQEKTPKDRARAPGQDGSDEDPGEAAALKKTDKAGKAGITEKERRLAAALRENLRRRKAAQRKETD